MQPSAELPSSATSGRPLLLSPAAIKRSSARPPAVIAATQAASIQTGSANPMQSQSPQAQQFEPAEAHTAGVKSLLTKLTLVQHNP